MRFANVAFTGKILVGLLALLATIPPIYAQRSQQPQRASPAPGIAPSPPGVPASRGEPSRGPEEHRPNVVDRSNHGTIRHVDTHMTQRANEAHRDIDEHQHVFVQRDMDADIDRSMFWRGFVYGRRVDALRHGYRRVLANGGTYYYDDGIYYQQADAGYTVVYPPIGVGVPALPYGAIPCETGNLTYYYAGGAYYVQQAGGFVTVAPPTGVIVPELPPGSVQVFINGAVAYQFNRMYYQPVFVNGLTQYMTFIP